MSFCFTGKAEKREDFNKTLLRLQRRKSIFPPLPLPCNLLLTAMACDDTGPCLWRHKQGLNKGKIFF